MKTILATTLLFLSSLGLGATRSFDVVVRNENHRPKVEKVELQDLISEDAFDGKHFKIVKGKEDAPIRFDADKELSFRAATVYYHLNKARDYFLHKLKSEYVASLPKLTIRIQHTNQFSELGHFSHDNFEPQYNNALTIPAGTGLERRGVKPWGMEIWFRPSKRIHLSEVKTNSLGAQEFKGLMKSFRNQIHMQSLQRFLSQAIMVMTNGSGPVGPLSLDNLVRTAGSSLIMEAGYQFYDPIGQLFSRKWYWLDTALVPEIIYHEYAHVALSDHLVLSHSTSIIEGMADFFAGQIANSPMLANKIKKYNTYNGKNAKRKQQYKIQFESTEYANTDFVFGLLWDMKKILGEERGEAFMYELRKNLTTNSSIRGQLIDGLLQNCLEMCESPFVDRLRILKALDSKGI